MKYEQILCPYLPFYGDSHCKTVTITRVRKDRKGTIIAYYVDGMGWVSKTQGISLVRQGKVDAVIATSRAGHLFLRTRPGTPVEVQLDHLG